MQDVDHQLYLGTWPLRESRLPSFQTCAGFTRARGILKNCVVPRVGISGFRGSRVFPGFRVEGLEFTGFWVEALEFMGLRASSL